MSRLWLVLVEPDPDEAERVTHAQIDEGLAWLERGIEEGYLADANSYANEDGTPRTGGYMIVVAEDRPALVRQLSTYPLLETIRRNLDIRPLNARLPDGFAVLHAQRIVAEAAQPH